ncbi:MAG: HU family DNA-binding protein [Thermodesulfobacteria bacterium]|nr:HU family DNA-binding protein [Thermodesulfobacteriota bacterium]
MSVGRRELSKRLKERVNALYQGPRVSDFLARRALETILSLIQESVSRGEPVSLRGFGTFGLKVCKPKKARNFRTGESIVLPERPRVVFRASSALLKRLRE